MQVTKPVAKPEQVMSILLFLEEKEKCHVSGSPSISSQRHTSSFSLSHTHMKATLWVTMPTHSVPFLFSFFAPSLLSTLTLFYHYTPLSFPHSYFCFKKKRLQSHSFILDGQHLKLKSSQHIYFFLVFEPVFREPDQISQFN